MRRRPGGGAAESGKGDAHGARRMTEPLRYGIIGGGFVSGFHLRALEQVPGVEVAGITSRTPPHELARSAATVGSARSVCSTASVRWSRTSTWSRCSARTSVASRCWRRSQPPSATARSFEASSARSPSVETFRRPSGSSSSPREIGVPTAYFENQIHMKMLQQARAQLGGVVDAMGPLTLVRSSEEHAGPHNAWFWDPTRQGGGVLSDMGCHAIAVGWHLLTPPGRGPRFLEPETVSCDIGLLKWGQPRWRAELLAQHGVDYERVPAEDFATGIVTYRNPETDQRVKGQFTVSWMYDKQGLRLLVDGLGPGYALEANSLRSPLEVFIGDAAATSVADAELALEKATASRGYWRSSRTNPICTATPTRTSMPSPPSATDDPRCSTSSTGSRSCASRWPGTCRPKRGESSTSPTRTLAARLADYVPLVQQGRGAEVLPLTTVEAERALPHLVADADHRRVRHGPPLPVRAVDHEGVSRDEARVGRREERRGPPELLALTDAQRRLAGSLSLRAVEVAAGCRPSCPRAGTAPARDRSPGCRTGPTGPRASRSGSSRRLSPPR